VIHLESNIEGLRIPATGMATPRRQTKLPVFFVEDHEITALGIRQVLESASWIRLVGDCRDGESALRMVPDSGAEILVLDLSLPKLDGIAVTKGLNVICPRLRIIWYSAVPVVQFVNIAKDLGVRAFIHKSCPPDYLLKGIQHVVDGGTLFSKTVFPVAPASDFGLEQQSLSLSDRHKEVLTLVGMGYINKEIADLLGMSTRTVETHCESILRRLNLRNRAELVHFAFKAGFVKL
jgi:DNA-binding NarL/FixJ family response regulator